MVQYFTSIDSVLILNMSTKYPPQPTAHLPVVYGGVSRRNSLSGRGVRQFRVNLTLEHLNIINASTLKPREACTKPSTHHGRPVFLAPSGLHLMIPYGTNRCVIQVNIVWPSYLPGLSAVPQHIPDRYNQRCSFMLLEVLLFGNLRSSLWSH
jgi:hypothetical protein